MKVLYAIQGTGNGHISRARDIVPILKKHCSVDVLLSGTQSDLDLPFEINFQLDGLGFVFGKSGGVDIVNTYKKNNIKRFLKEVKNLDLSPYDLIINDFEPVSAWAAYRQKKVCIGLSHQIAVISPKSPRPSMPDPIGLMILKTYAPVAVKYGFHFQRYDENIFTPVIRQQIRTQKPKVGNHYTVYLPSYEDKKVVKILSQVDSVQWEVFSKHSKECYVVGNIKVFPIQNNEFIKSMVSSAGVLCGAGFETPAEALYLKKKLLVIPMKNQYEQQCNAHALELMGVSVLKSLKKKYINKLKEWVDVGTTIKVEFPDETEKIILDILKKYWCE